VPFHPYYTAKDSIGLCVFLLLFAVLVFFAPNFFGEPDNYVPANPLVTPAAIVPEWYFLPFYAILRAVPDKLLGVLCMFGSILIWFVLPWLDTSPVRSARFRPIYRIMMPLLVVDMFVLGAVGAHHPEGIWIILGRLGTAWYFFHFAALPFLGLIEKPLPLPESISRAVLEHRTPPSGGGGGPLPSGAAAKPMEKI
jgi:ubiquinol-cytochrome c reductase cytochrome b subunit